MFRLRTAGSTRGGGRIRAMRAETVIATHTNADFDALASLLAVRRLYPGSVAALPGSLARNVREFYRLHADELDVCETSRLDPAAIERLVVVETVHASRLGELEPVARDPQIEKVVFDHHGDALPDWLPPENAILSDDAALTTTLVGVLAEREMLATLLDSLETHTIAGLEVVVAAASSAPGDVSVSTLAHKLVDLTEARALVCLLEMDGRVFCVVRSQAPELDARALAERLGGGGHPGAASATFKGTLEDALRRTSDALPEAVREPVRAA